MGRAVRCALQPARLCIFHDEENPAPSPDIEDSEKQMYLRGQYAYINGLGFLRSSPGKTRLLETLSVHRASPDAALAWHPLSVFRAREVEIFLGGDGLEYCSDRSKMKREILNEIGAFLEKLFAVQEVLDKGKKVYEFPLMAGVIRSLIFCNCLMPMDVILETLFEEGRIRREVYKAWVRTGRRMVMTHMDEKVCCKLCQECDRDRFVLIPVQTAG
ncbi:hypothetical protein L202_04484 [Cryptococcus amylolentus CBS 6039]|uniref:Uncharacterized protein n=1 Tax=Cryptococcus amylolentus CBS 6039 TaxID=1295533 RepID=A0A1E3HRI3_9TREE|nr:hypothetical protein L202_04484 [Cryptococcus amylolentus CBS 6039]ODN78970.1 hypothetical protein L202_04484 [Cryptococcus amylolentus CBS 6039]